MNYLIYIPEIYIRRVLVKDVDDAGSALTKAIMNPNECIFDSTVRLQKTETPDKWKVVPEETGKQLASLVEAASIVVTSAIEEGTITSNHAAIHIMSSLLMNDEFKRFMVSHAWLDLGTNPEENEQ